MTSLEAMDQFDRLLAAGFALPSGTDQATVFQEWATAFASVDREDVAAGISKLVAGRVDRFWPTVGELRGAIASVQAGREPLDCRRCRGSRWVAARPYRANGSLLYEGVVRCPDCGVPAPTRVGDAHQTPLSDREYAEWRDARRPAAPVTSRDEFLARVAALQARFVSRRMPAVEVTHG